MSLLNMLMNAQNGDGRATRANQCGVPQDKVSASADMLAPTVGAAAKQQANSGNLQSLLGALQGEGAAHFLENPAAAAEGSGRDQGAAFLQNLIGSAEGTETLAQEAASRAGVEAGQAQAIMSALGPLASLTFRLDADGVGSAVDDILGKILKR